MQDDQKDHIDLRREQWAKVAPEVDTLGMALFGRIRQIHLGIRPRIEAIFDDYGIDGGEADVIFTLYRTGEPFQLRPTELYCWLMVSSGGITHRLNRLEKAGLIERVSDPDDRRSMLVSLTDKGQYIAKTAFTQDMAVEKEALSVLSAEEQQQLSALLRKLLLSL